MSYILELFKLLPLYLTMSTFADLPELLRLQNSWVTFHQLQSIQTYFGSLDSAFQASVSDWVQADLLNEQQLQKLFADDFEQEVDAALEWGEQLDQGWLTMGEEDYPQKLLQISDPPILLGYKGNKALLSDPQVAIVGSRHASKAGAGIAEDFAQYLSSQGLTITSGLALGIDAAAHRGGLQGIGKTVAVVATGLDRIYPASNKALGQQIVEQGVMISEFSLGTKPINYNFPKRNRIISGLSLGTLVVEAALKSGSLITAKTAMEQGREVFAVPGSIHNPQAKGCHQLIKQGAKLVESGQDILEELAALLQGDLESMAIPAKGKKGSQLDLLAKPEKNSSALLELIDYDPVSLDELVVLSKMPVSSLQSELLMLEMAGEVEAMSAARWRRIR